MKFRKYNSGARQVAHRAGLTLLETTIVLIIAIAAITAGANYYSQYLQNQINRVAAQQMKTVSDAFGKYLEDNITTVSTQVGPVGYAAVAINDLKPQYLPVGFSNRNAFGQSFQLAVRKPDPARVSLEAIVYTTGGEEIEPNRALLISQVIGASGGFTMKGGNRNQVRSTFDGYTLNLADFGANMTASGKLVSALFMNDSGSVVEGGEYLYRSTVPGRPELNRMNTQIDMNNNALTNAEFVHSRGAIWAENGNITAQNGNIVSDQGSILGRHIESAGGVAAGGLVVGEQVNSRGNMYAAGRIDAESDIRSNSYISGRDIWSDTNVHASNQVYAGNYIHSQGSIYAASNIRTDATMSASVGYIDHNIDVGNRAAANTLWTRHQAQPGQGCGDEWGTIARTPEGGLISCVQGTWRLPGSVGFNPNGQYHGFPINGEGHNTTPYIWYVTIFNGHDKAANHHAWVDGTHVVAIEGGNYSIKANGSFIVRPGQHWRTQFFGSYPGSAIAYM